MDGHESLEDHGGMGDRQGEKERHVQDRLLRKGKGLRKAIKVKTSINVPICRSTYYSDTDSHQQNKKINENVFV